MVMKKLKELRLEDLSVEQERLAQEAIEEGLKIRKFQDPFLERATIQRRVADYLVNRNTLMLHGSTISVDGRAYLCLVAYLVILVVSTRVWEAFL